MLGHLVSMDHAADCERDLCRAAQRSASAHHGRLDACQIALCGSEQFLALTAALRGQIGIAADHQTLAWEVGRRDGGHVALIEQRQLHSATLQQTSDCRRTQRGDPVEAGGFDLVGDACLGDHAAVTDQHHVLQSEALLQLVDLH
jgi:hypothetical protein